MVLLFCVVLHIIPQMEHKINIQCYQIWNTLFVQNRECTIFGIFLLTLFRFWYIIRTQDAQEIEYSLFFYTLCSIFGILQAKGVIVIEDVFNFIKPELLILIPVLYFIGLGIKKSSIPNKNIPLLLGIISIFLSTLWVFSTSEINNWQDVTNAVFVSITQGILTAGTTVYANQLYIQFKK